ncbi:class IV adenylate cyclase [Streptomyces sp. NPDC052396]|uniref:class IV adenylate cyclase n=1 Tax=Streptomyces sp. NPDC052396 TaxID=3365689 RepID=UPI0037D9363E
MIEAELKARVEDPAAVRQRLEQRVDGRNELYRDTYYDTPAGTLAGEDRELRVRTVQGANGARNTLTYKEARVAGASGSKPEHETAVDNPTAMHATLRGLGYVPTISFEKHCRNYSFAAYGRQMLATLVRVPEISGTFIELETMAEEPELQAALADVSTVLSELGVADDCLTTELYTETVAAAREQGRGHHPRPPGQ